MIIDLIIHLIKIGAVIGVMLGIVAYTVMLERWVCAWMQDRFGPNRVGPFGLLQPLADGVKLILKEDVLPHHVNKVLYTLGPMLVMIPALINIGVVPWGSNLPILGRDVKCVIADLNIGIMFPFAFAALSVYGIVLAGWASNSKYPFLGGIRSSAQMISYEVCLGLSVVPVSAAMVVAPVSVIVPESVFAPPTLCMAPAPPTPLPVMKIALAGRMPPDSSSVAPDETVAAPVPSAAVFPACAMPLLTKRPPVKVLLPFRMSLPVPVPSLIRS